MLQNFLTLLPPTIDLAAEFLDMLAEYQRANEVLNSHKGAQPNFTAYVLKLQRQTDGNDLPPGYVPCTTYWLVNAVGRLLGECRLRHTLTPDLLVEGGHIGYAIRPSERRKGYGTVICALAVEKARQMGITRIRITCDADNIGSARIIEKNGGILDGQSISPESGKLISQYWIEV